MKRFSYPPNQIWTVLSVVFWALMPIPIQGAKFIVLDEVLGQRTSVSAVSGDGSTVVGGYWPGTNFPTAMVWTPENGIVELPGDVGEGEDLNYDGSVIVGDSAGIDSDLVIWENGVLAPANQSARCLGSSF